MTTFYGEAEGSISIPKNSNIRYAKFFVGQTVFVH